MTSNTSRRVMLMAKGATKAAGFKRLHSDREQGIGWEVWTLNDMPPTEWTTAHFELHAMTPVYREWISSRVDLAKYPQLYLQQADVTLPNSIAFPIRGVIDASGSNYLANTVALQLALLYMQHKEGYEVDTIALYGVDYVTAETMAQMKIRLKKDDRELFKMGAIEATYGRACCEYWLGRLAELKIKFLIHAHSELFTTSPGFGRHVYGYEGNIIGGRGAL